MWYVWRREERLIARFKFKSFLDAVDFVKEVAAEQYNHHPDIEIHYDEVVIITHTHAAGGVVTEKDILLAEKITEIYQRLKAEGKTV